MKTKSLFFLAVLCLASTVHSQDSILFQDTATFESLFGQESTEWSGSMEDYDFLWGGLLRTGIDTVIDGMQYKKVEYSNAELYNGTYYESRDSDHDFYLREDTSTGKLWSRLPDMFSVLPVYPGVEQPQEVLIADMALSTGDTFMALVPSFDYPYWLDSVLFIVDDTMTIDHRRIIVLSGRSGGHEEQIKFIEGVGCTNIFEYGLFYDACGSKLWCCHKDGELVYHWRSSEDDGDCTPSGSIGGIESRESQRSISVHPNPCIDKVWISGMDIQSATLLDVKGNVLKPEIDPRQPLDISTLPPGVYIIRLVANNFVVSKTIIKK